MLVLIVDDHFDASELMSLALRHEGHRTLAALDGEAAIDLCREHMPDAVLLDIGLPDMDGYEVACKLRSEVGFKGKIIAISGYDADSTLQAAFGVNLHLRKPLRLDGLCEVLAAPIGT